MDAIAYIATTTRKGETYCLTTENGKPFVGKLYEYLPTLFGSEEQAFDSVFKYTEFKKWNIDEVRITNA